MQGKLLTNKQRCIRGLSNVDTYPRCDNASEDILHLFFNCPNSANVWSRFPNVQVPTTVDLEEWRVWLQANINQIKVVSGGFPNSILVIVTLWKIWIARNKKVFDDINPDPNIIYRQ